MEAIEAAHQICTAQYLMRGTCRDRRKLVHHDIIMSTKKNSRHSKNWKLILIPKIKYIGVPAILKEIHPLDITYTTTTTKHFVPSELG